MQKLKVEFTVVVSDAYPPHEFEKDMRNWVPVPTETLMVTRESGRLVPLVAVVSDDAPEDYDPTEDLGLLLTDFHERRKLWDDGSQMYVLDVTRPKVVGE